MSTPESPRPEQPEQPEDKPRLGETGGLENVGGAGRARIGVLGVVLTALVVITALQIDKLPFLSPVSTYTVDFEDTGGLTSGDHVVVAGINVGTVEGLKLVGTDEGTRARVSFRMQDDIVPGIDTRAAIKTETVLGRRNLTIMPLGPGRIEPGQNIPASRTIAPYSLTDGLEDATGTLEDTDTDQLNLALATLTETFSETPEQVNVAVQGIADLSRSIAERDDALRELLSRARDVTSIVGDRNEQINQMLVDANALFGELQLRRQAIDELITGIRQVTEQIIGFIDDNNAQLTPVLSKFNRVLDILNDNKQSFSDAIDQLGPYANILGEAVSSGPYFSSLVGVATFGDYWGTFMKVLQRKYPEAWEYFNKYSGFPPLPQFWEPGPPVGSDLPQPTVESTYPTPPSPPSGG